jgi:hypothetical protein
MCYFHATSDPDHAAHAAEPAHAARAAESAHAAHAAEPAHAAHAAFAAEGAEGAQRARVLLPRVQHEPNSVSGDCRLVPRPGSLARAASASDSLRSPAPPLPRSPLSALSSQLSARRLHPASTANTAASLGRAPRRGWGEVGGEAGGTTPNRSARSDDPACAAACFDDLHGLPCNPPGYRVTVIELPVYRVTGLPRCRFTESPG